MGNMILLKEAFYTKRRKKILWLGQANQPLSQEHIDIKLSEYINSTKSEDKLKIGQFSLITISSMAIDANSAKTTLSTEFTHKGKRYKAEMLITQKEV